ncbi:hypothetical protein EYF80_037539 [Liparis tanakae]|uniref:Uncharacterized protein n=1 Tax=Liparis tanakae TaxID=230148 RepID=A0A4Z2GH87_9TELE|nr:hypothetical protein EYF80_037539 [Liparis tanakae]
MARYCQSAALAGTGRPRWLAGDNINVLSPQGEEQDKALSQWARRDDNKSQFWHDNVASAHTPSGMERTAVPASAEMTAQARGLWLAAPDELDPSALATPLCHSLQVNCLQRHMEFGEN